MLCTDFCTSYNDIFSPVARIASINFFLSIIVVSDWPLHQLTSKNAFLHQELEDKVYMEKPPSFVAQTKYSDLVLWSLYDLKQSPQSWIGKFNTVIQEFGITHNESWSFSVLLTLHQICIFGNVCGWNACKDLEALPNWNIIRSVFLYQDLGKLHWGIS